MGGEVHKRGKSDNDGFNLKVTLEEAELNSFGKQSVGVEEDLLSD